MPSWNGNPFEFEDYKIGCERLVDGTKDEDQHLLGPRLAARLTGQAWLWQQDVDLDRTKLRAKNGVDYLMDFLKGKQDGDRHEDMGKSFGEYLYVHHRAPGQGLTQYTTDTKKLIKKTEQSLKKALEAEKPGETVDAKDYTLPAGFHAWFWK